MHVTLWRWYFTRPGNLRWWKHTFIRWLFIWLHDSGNRMVMSNFTITVSQVLLSFYRHHSIVCFIDHKSHNRKQSHHHVEQLNAIPPRLGVFWRKRTQTNLGFQDWQILRFFKKTKLWFQVHCEVYTWQLINQKQNSTTTVIDWLIWSCTLQVHWAHNWVQPINLKLRKHGVIEPSTNNFEVLTFFEPNASIFTCTVIFTLIPTVHWLKPHDSILPTWVPWTLLHCQFLVKDCRFYDVNHPVDIRHELYCGRQQQQTNFISNRNSKCCTVDVLFSSWHWWTESSFHRFGRWFEICMWIRYQSE